MAMLLLVMPNEGYTKTNETTTSLADSRVSEEVIAERIAQLPLPFEGRNTAQVRSYIRSYLVEGYRGSEDILGRADVYFPIFEHYLRMYNLPEELKYLPIVESALRPAVHSPVGAAGLWQFIPSTARIYGLTVNNQVDERLDPHKSTEAAVKMLSSLHDQFGDWGLVLAAYNCGPGRVRKAIRSAGSKNFWSVQAYLPRESQRYIPGFIAAAYVINYGGSHGLTPDYLATDLQNTRTFLLTRSLHLSTVARQLNVSYGTLQKLNPAFTQGLIPQNNEGHYITIPTRTVSIFVDRFLSINQNLNEQGFMKSEYTTVPGDKMSMLTQLFQCTKEDIMTWNNLSSEKLTVNQQLIILLPRNIVRP